MREPTHKTLFNQMHKTALKDPLFTADTNDSRYFRQVDNLHTCGITINNCLDAMDGVPVWLSSISRRGIDGRIIPNALWDERQMKEVRDLVFESLDGVGDPQRQRLFRMNITLCLHRALSQGELAQLPEWWFQKPGVHLAGGPIEILYESVPGSLSTKPCANPKKARLPGLYNGEYMWIPVDCGVCETCRARLAVEENPGVAHLPV